MDYKQKCQYGEKCYRKSKDHLEKFHNKNTNANKTLKITDLFTRKDKIDESSKRKCEFTENEKKRTKVDDEDRKDNITKHINVHDFDNYNDRIEKMLFHRMPDDFFHLWNLCYFLNNTNPQDVFKEIDLKLVGPYDLLTGTLLKYEKLVDHDDDLKGKLICHYRYFYDPPEFITTLQGSTETDYHIGYFRDDRDSKSIVVSNEALKSPVFKSIGDNIFVAIINKINEKKRKESVPKKEKLNNLLKEIENFCTNNKITLNATVEVKKRKQSSIGNTTHSLNIVVPLEKEGDDFIVGYRTIPMSNAKFNNLLKQIETNGKNSKANEEIENLVRLVNLANDECDFGMGLELGLNFFSSDCEIVNHHILFLLTTAYNLLNRNYYAEIIKAHLNNRSKQVFILN